MQDDWDEQFRAAPDGEEAISPHSCRLVAFSRLTIQLTQAVMHAELRDGSTWRRRTFRSCPRWVDAEFLLPCSFVLNLASC